MRTVYDNDRDESRSTLNMKGNELVESSTFFFFLNEVSFATSKIDTSCIVQPFLLVSLKVRSFLPRLLKFSLRIFQKRVKTLNPLQII